MSETDVALTDSLDPEKDVQTVETDVAVTDSLDPEKDVPTGETDPRDDVSDKDAFLT
jgi:hypothetical protein